MVIDERGKGFVRCEKYDDGEKSSPGGCFQGSEIEIGAVDAIETNEEIFVVCED